MQQRREPEPVCTIIYQNYEEKEHEKKQSLDTICIQGGWQPKNGEPRQLPIYQSTTFKYTTSEQMGRLFDLEENGYFYTRLANPTNDAVAAKICELEGGAGAILHLPVRQLTSML